MEEWTKENKNWGKQRTGTNFLLKEVPRSYYTIIPLVSHQPDLDHVVITSCKRGYLSVGSITAGHVPCHCLTSKEWQFYFHLYVLR